MKKIFIFLLCLILVVAVAAFTPQNDIDLRNVYAIRNATNTSGANANYTGFVQANNFIGDGSALTGIVSVSNASKGGTQPYILDDGTNHSLSESALNSTINDSIDLRVTQGFLTNLGFLISSAIDDLINRNFTLLDTRKLNKTDQRYNNSNINTTSNIQGLGFTTGSHTTDTNESNRMSNITSFACTGSDKVINFSSEARPTCGSDLVNSSDQMIAATNGLINSTSWERNGTNIAKANPNDRVCFNADCTFFINSTCIRYPSGGLDCSA